MKKLALISLILLAIGVITYTSYCYYYDSVKLNIINKSDYLINSFSIKYGEEKIELSKLQPQSKTVKRLYSFTGQKVSFTLNCRNQLSGHSKSGVSARNLSEINIIIENSLVATKDRKNTRIPPELVKIKSDLVYKKH